MTHKTTMPEPFTGLQYNTGWNSHEEVISSAIGSPGVIAVFTESQMQAYADACVREALMEAYRSMQELHMSLMNDTSHCVSPAQVASFAANRISALIKSKETT